MSLGFAVIRRSEIISTIADMPPKRSSTMSLPFKILICFLAGAGAGIGTGFAGMSAAAIIGPMLAAFLGMPAYQALGIGLVSDVLASAISAYIYHKHGNLDIRNSLPLLISVLIMTVVGSFIGSLVPNSSLGSMQQIGLICVGLKFLLKPGRASRESMAETDQRTRFLKAVLGGTIVGFICGFIGAGGGMMLLFVLTVFLGYEMHMAVGTSVFIMMFTAFTGGVSHMAIGGIPDLVCVVSCIVFTFLWARVASKIANRIDSITLSRAAGCVMVGFSVVILVVDHLL